MVQGEPKRVHHRHGVVHRQGPVGVLVPACQDQLLHLLEGNLLVLDLAAGEALVQLQPLGLQELVGGDVPQDGVQQGRLQHQLRLAAGLPAEDLVDLGQRHLPPVPGHGGHPGKL